MKIKLTLAIAAIGMSVLGIGCACHRPPPGDQTGMMEGPGMRGHHPWPSSLMQALDVNHDGVIDAEEISNAPAELRTLDKNGDGRLTPDELRPPRPPMNNSPQSGPEKPYTLPPG